MKRLDRCGESGEKRIEALNFGIKGEIDVNYS